MAGKIPGKMLLDGTVTVVKLSMDADLPMGTHKITGLVNGSDAQDAVTKTQLDAAVAGLDWQAPAKLKNYEGNYSIAGIDGLTPTAGDSVVATSAGTPAAGTSDALVIGDVAEFDGTQWKKIVSAVGGFVPLGTRLVVSPDTVDGAIIVAADYGKICQFGGASNTPTKTSPADGWAIFIDGEASVNENSGFVFDGAVPTGLWIQFTGLGSITAGNGLDKIGSTIFIKPDGTSTAVSGTGLKAAVPTQADKNLTALVTAADNAKATLSTVTAAPGGDGDIQVRVNGVHMQVSDNNSGECYFGQGDTTTARAKSAVVAGDTLRWNGTVAGFELAATDKIDFVYNVA